MGDILSQNEIDDLLAQLSTGEINAQEYRNETSEKKIKEMTLKDPANLRRII